MCNSRCSDAIFLTISILLGIGLTILSFFNAITAFLLGPWIAMGLAGFSLLILTLTSTSLLRQDSQINRCFCKKAKHVLWSALLLLAVAVFSVVFALTNLWISLVLAFIIATLFVYVLLSLYCLLTCFAEKGCPTSVCED